MALNKNYTTQNELLLNNLMAFYNKDNSRYLTKILPIINGESGLSIRIIDWFVTNYSKKNYVVYDIEDNENTNQIRRFKVYIDYKLKLKAYSKRRFDPFCRWDRINVPYLEGTYVQTTIGQLNFFKWALENKILDYIQDNLKDIERDMNCRNSTTKRKDSLVVSSHTNDNNKTRKKREELSISAVKSIKKENVEIVVKFN